jgi:hypothetical protein
MLQAQKCRNCTLLQNCTVHKLLHIFLDQSYLTFIWEKLLLLLLYDLCITSVAFLPVLLVAELASGLFTLYINKYKLRLLRHRHGNLSIRVATSSEAWIIFVHFNAETLGSNPTRRIYVSVSLFCLSCPVSRYRPCNVLIPHLRSPTTLHRIKKLKKKAKVKKRAVEPLIRTIMIM